MVIDSSAIVAILQNEPERRDFTVAIEDASVVRISAASFVETSIVIQARYGSDGIQILDQFIETAKIHIEAFDAHQARLARDAFRRFGKGRHKASLNMGDCFSYALAVQVSEPLLFKGDDFCHTDMRHAT